MRYFTGKALRPLRSFSNGVVMTQANWAKKLIVAHFYLSLSLLGILVLDSTTVQAGVIFTNQATFSAAVSGLQLAWSEDFEGFSIGEVPDPLVIGGGNAVHRNKSVNNSRSNIKNNLATNHDLESPNDANPTIAGPGDTALDVHAISFVFGDQLGVSWAFDTTLLGTDLSPDFLPTGETPDLFIGWIGITPDENLVSFRAVATKGISGNIIDIDNIAAFVPTISAVPEPATLVLLGLGLAGLGFSLRKKA